MKHRINYYIFILCTLLYSCNSVRESDYFAYNDKLSFEDSILLDSLFNFSGHVVGDKKLAALNQSLQITKQKDYPISRFRIYLLIAGRYSNDRKKDSALLYLDSAHQILVSKNMSRLMPEYYLALGQRYDLLYTDSSTYFLELALRDTSNLSSQKKAVLLSSLSANCLGMRYFERTKAYALESMKHLDLQPNKHQSMVVLYSYLYNAEMGLKDTLAAVSYLKKGIDIIEDSLSGQGPPNTYRFMGNYFLDKHEFDSAQVYYTKYYNLIQLSNPKIAEFLPNIHFAQVYLGKGNIDSFNYYFYKAQKNMPPIETIIPSTLSMYYDIQYEYAKNINNQQLIIEALEKKNEILKKLNKEINSDALSTLEEKLETARSEKIIFEKDKKLKQQKTFTLIMIICCLAIATIGILLYNNLRTKKRLERKKLLLEQQYELIERNKLLLNVENKERQRISQEIHDDIGPALTTLNLAAVMLNNAELEEGLKKSVSIITKNTTWLSEQMNEIIWSLNINNDKLQSLVAHIKLFATNFLENTNIKLVFDVQIETHERIIEGYKRRHIYLALKEIINNAVKHAQASIISIVMIEKENSLYIKVADNGVGLPDNAINSILGNGLKNTAKNIHKMNGQINVFNNNGCNTELNIPLEY